MAFFYTDAYPVDGIYLAYDQLIFGIGNAIAAGNPDPAVEVEVWINGAKYKSSKFPTYITKGLNLGFNFYRWEFDPLKVVQDWFDNETFLRPIADTGYLEGNGWQAEFSLRLYDWEPDPVTGKLVRETTFFDSQLYTVYNSTANLGEVRDLAEYRPGSVTYAKFLTNKPNRVRVGYDESEWLYFISYSMSVAQVIFYNEDGTVRGQGQIPFLGQANFLGEEVGSIAIGPANINAMAPGGWVNSSGTVTVDENVAFYTVQCGIEIPGLGNFFGMTEVRRYYPSDNRERAYRLHFINGFGVVDSFSAFGQESEEYDVESTRFQRPLARNLSSRSRQTTRIQSTATRSVQGLVQNADPETLDFLRYFQRSVNVWIEEDGQYWAIEKEDGSFQTIPQDRGLSSFEFAATYSVNQISQRN